VIFQLLHSGLATLVDGAPFDPDLLDPVWTSGRRLCVWDHCQATLALNRPLSAWLSPCATPRSPRLTDLTERLRRRLVVLG
jgi:hypothetical protein